MLTDIEIARQAKIKPIAKIAKKLKIKEKNLSLCGKYIAKVESLPLKQKGKLILVTAMSPTPYGEGKTTVSIGLADGLNLLGKKTALALREPSLGPVFGMKGGATGGGKAQVIPMEDINLHFTGDMHAITASNNLLCAMVNNHIFQGNALDLNVNNLTHRYCMDLNERALREVRLEGYASGFDISAASEVMAILCLCEDLEDLKKKLGNILIGYTNSNEPVFAHNIKANEAMAILLKDAIKPNLCQTLEGTPAFIHGGPFANIAHGCNTIIATKTALGVSDYVVTEAGFGADLGAEKFLDIKCRIGNLEPSIVVIVATVRALKYNGGVKKEDILKPNLQAVNDGLANLKRHIDNIIEKFHLPAVVALNKFVTDTDEEVQLVKKLAKSAGAGFSVTEGWEKGGEGALQLAEEVIVGAQKPSKLTCIYSTTDSIEQKIEKIAKEIYGAAGVEFTNTAKQKMEMLLKIGKSNLPVCIAKTQYSFSDNMERIGAPTGFTLKVNDITPRLGAGFIVVQCGKVMLMPGLPKVPAAEGMSINGKMIKGLF